jgi:hypothetical protein
MGTDNFAEAKKLDISTQLKKKKSGHPEFLTFYQTPDQTNLTVGDINVIIQH